VGNKLPTHCKRSRVAANDTLQLVVAATLTLCFSQ
jgi:hypothetical protein